MVSEINSRSKTKGQRAKFVTKALIILTLPLFIALSLFSTLFDPVASFAKQLAAIVNLDEGTEIDGQMVPLGRQFAQQLAKNADSTYDWQLTNSSDAAAGLKSGKYLVVVTIPETFSKEISSYTTPENLKQAQLRVEFSELAKIEDRLVANTLLETANSVFSQYFSGETLQAMLSGFAQLGSSVGQLSDGSAALADGSRSLADGLGQYAAGVSQIAPQVETLAQASTQLLDAQQQLSDGAKTLSAGTSQLTAGIEPLVAGGKALSQGTKSLAEGLNQLNQQLQQLPSAAEVESIVAGMAATTSVFSSLTTTVCGNFLLSSLCSTFQGFQASIDQFASTATGIMLMIPALQDGVAQLSAGGDMTSAGVDQYVAGVELYLTGLEQYFQGVQALTSGVQMNAAGSKPFFEGINQLAGGVGQLTAATVPLAEGSNQLADGATQLSDGLALMADNVPSYSDSDVDKITDAITAPISTGVDLWTKNLNQIPLYLILALAFGSIICFLFFSPYPKDLISTSQSAITITLRYLALPALAMLLCSVAISTLAYFNLSLSPLDAVNFYLFTALCALMFSAAQQLFVALFGRSGGTLIGLVFAILILCQWLVSPGNDLISAFYSFTPHRFAIETLMSFSGGLDYNYLNLMGILVLLAVGFFGTVLVIRYRRRVK
jgi:putative membrane protein